MAKKPQQIKFNVRSRSGNIVIAAVALLLAYAVASRAIDTGSLQQYALTLLLVVLAVNRLIVAVRNN